MKEVLDKHTATEVGKIAGLNFLSATRATEVVKLLAMQEGSTGPTLSMYIAYPKNQLVHRSCSLDFLVAQHETYWHQAIGPIAKLDPVLFNDL